jgi:hypothetical protein
VSTNNPLVKTALLTLLEVWPRPVPFEALWTAVRSRLAAAPDPVALHDARPLAEALLHCYLSRLVELHVHLPPFVLDPGERPVASPLARLQASTETLVTNVRHHSVELNELDRVLLPLLDGSRDRNALVAALTELVGQGVFQIRHEGQPVRDRAVVQQILTASLQPSLRRLARSALLVG